ncbi:MAG TPA: hypothetical protein VLR94_10560 [Acidobacteriota bacterium]|nr:hypothetical protein [Acidobacteriota bacterium]
MRDLIGAPERTVKRERQKVEHQGWGARLLGLQDPEGTWGGGLYNPKWTSTLYTMLLLRDFGLPPSNEQARSACLLLLNKGLRPDGGVNFVQTDRSETCISGMALSVVSYCQCDDERLDTIAGHLLEHQMPDGGWNCRHPHGATHASVHTSISVLEGLRLYELNRRRNLQEVRRAQRRAREFLLIHQLFRSHRTGNVIKSEFKRFSFPPRWHYDVLRALDYFQSVDAPRDWRLAEAIDILLAKKRPDGRWQLQNCYKGRSHFELERLGAPSRWNTLRALRVLKWWKTGGVGREGNLD